MQQLPEHEQLPSGKTIRRQFSEDGTLIGEEHTYGIYEISMSMDPNGGDEVYFVKRRLVSRKSYEKARVAYPDMPPANSRAEDLSGSVSSLMRQQQKQKKLDAERRFVESTASKYPRPDCTNWLRVTISEKSHLVTFASRDWKLLSRESSLPTGRQWLRLFGFSASSNVAVGLEVGFEVSSETQAMLRASQKLLAEVNAFIAATEASLAGLSSSERARKKKIAQQSSWPRVLPPLIEFLAGLTEPSVYVFNHHL